MTFEIKTLERTVLITEHHHYKQINIWTGI